MKQRPILFQGAMVRALLNGTKTQTRRVVRKQFAHDATPAEVAATSPEGWQISGHSGLWWDDAGACIDDAVRCPYGQPGDQLWVRETWAQLSAKELDVEPMFDPAFVYFAQTKWDKAVQYLCADGVARWALPKRWKPSIHMPRVASRITLEITGVRVERLQDIGEADALAEGIDQDTCAPVATYRDLWESINGHASWDLNPWVWVVEFKRVQP